MRRAFLTALAEIAERDPRIVFLTGDLGYLALEPFRDRFPDRFFNAGVAEQNMIGVATGLAEAGFIPFAYSIATFAALRPFEFVRNGPVLHRLPVRVVGMGMGFEYGPQGPTHHACEDVGVMRTLPGLTVVIPADHAQAAAAVHATWNLDRPVYYSLGKDDRTTVPGLDGRFGVGALQVLRPAVGGVGIVAMGSIAAEAAAAADLLAAEGRPVGLAVVSTFNPAPVDELAQFLARCSAAVTVEAHVVAGGLGAQVAEVIAERGIGCKLKIHAIRRSPDGHSGSQASLWRKHGLDRASLVGSARELAAERPSPGRPGRAG
jgi:transketolase